jgi:hypothetical protein
MAPDTITPSRRPRRFRTILHGVCLLVGKHPPGSVLARECPVLTAQARSDRAKRSAQTRRQRPAKPA